MASCEKGSAASAGVSQPSLAEQLRGTHGRVFWRDLRAHAERNSLFLFSGDEALVRVAEALARDSVGEVSAWAASGALRRPTRQELALWRDRLDTPFESIVVQPFVLARALPESEGSAPPVSR